MKMHLNKTILAILACGLVIMTAEAGRKGKRWTEEQANAWYAQLPWLVGCNYNPATAINQIEMWSDATYDPVQIDKELTWAEEIGFNTMRVFLSSVVWEHNPQELKNNMNHFLGICEKHHIRPFFVLLDDNWLPESSYGKQPEPQPGVHNSGWVKDPALSLRKDTVQLYRFLRRYFKDVIGSFRNDKRILFWDIYNEPGAQHIGVVSYHLMKKTYEWAREARPSQPITSSICEMGPENVKLQAFQLENNDINTYHNYKDAADQEQMIKYLRMANRPLLCTEYMARKFNSTFQTVLPILKKHRVGAINWGFVAGKTQTNFAWGEPLPDKKEPELWFHDILRMDGTPFSQEEVDTIKALLKDNGRF